MQSKYSMKCLFMLASITAATVCFGQENYTVQLGDSNYNVSLDSTYQLSLHGKTVSFTLKQKPVLNFKDTLFSFSYPQGFQITKTKVDSTVDQYLALTADATGFMLQAYRTINPTGLNETMLREITKQNLSYGYTMKREDTTRILKSGQTVNVTKAVLTFKDDKYTFEVASLGSRDEGILVITIDGGLDYTGKGREMIRLLWDSLKYNK